MFKESILWIFDKAGLEIRRKPVSESADLSQSILEHPVDALYCTRWDENTIVSAKPEIIINSLGFSFSPNGYHPFVKTLLQFKNQEIDAYHHSALREYYQYFQPKNLMELMLGYSNPKSSLSKYPPIDFGIPFSYCNSFDKVINTARKWIRNENYREGIKNDDLIYGSQTFGPTNKEKGKAEFQRLVRVYQSIKNQGYQRKKGGDGDIRGYLLRRENEFRVVVFGGHHRTAALSALGYQQIPICLRSNFLIELRDLKHWPLVKAGVWPEVLAKEYFNRLFDKDKASEKRSK